MKHRNNRNIKPFLKSSSLLFVNDILNPNFSEMIKISLNIFCIIKINFYSLGTNNQEENFKHIFYANFIKFLQILLKIFAIDFLQGLFIFFRLFSITIHNWKIVKY